MNMNMNMNMSMNMNMDMSSVWTWTWSMNMNEHKHKHEHGAECYNAGAGEEFSPASLLSQLVQYTTLVRHRHSVNITVQSICTQLCLKAYTAQ
jgi:hypothetical protein